MIHVNLYNEIEEDKIKRVTINDRMYIRIRI